MTKPLLYYCNSPVDEPVFRSIEEMLETMASEDKLAMALTALSLRLRPDKKPIDVGLEFEESQLVEQLTPQGQLELVQALVTQVRES